MSLGMKQVGFWSGGYGDNAHHSNAWDCIDSDWDIQEHNTVVAHLRRGEATRHQKGFSKCRICGNANGSYELTDGIYRWPSGFLHYILEHDVKPPQEFINHCLETANV